jgi:arylsulfatase A-like enzyme
MYPGSLSRKQFLVQTAGLALSATAIQAAAQPAGRRPNILLIVTDDQGWGDLPSNGYKTDVRMPNMDGIGEAGVRFDSFYVNPLCGPTRASLLTGLYSMENGMWRGPSRQDTDSGNVRGIPSRIRFLSEYLRDAGYATGAFGKWHLGYGPGEVPNDRGFEEFYGFLSGAHTYRLNSDTPTFLHNKEQHCEEAHATDYIADKALAFLAERGTQEAPFFCYVAFNAVHGPLWRADHPVPMAKEEWLERAAARGIDFPRRDYVATLEHMDARIGDLLARLRELNADKHTLVFCLSDNGALTVERDDEGPAYPGNNGPFRDGKGSVYEGGIRSACVAQWPGVVPPGAVSRDLALHADVFATCLAAAGLPVSETNGGVPLRGVDLLPHLKSGTATPIPARAVVFELVGRVAYRKGRYKLVTSVESSRAQWTETAAQLEDAVFELYDLEADRGESRDLSAEHPETCEELKREMVAYFSNLARQ